MKITVDQKLDAIKISDDDLIEQIQREYNNALDFRKPRINDWHANEDMLYGRKPKTLSKRSNIDLRLMKGFEDTLLSKIKNPPVVKYQPTEEADKTKAKKVTALWELESSPSQQNWKFKDKLSKKLSLPSGRVITKIYATAKPYKHHREEIDHYDFLIDPLAGGYDIENARYLGQDNIFKSKFQLENNPKYDQEKVKELVGDDTERTSTAEADNQYKEKANRFAVLGLNTDEYNWQKDGLYKLLEWYTTINGDRWYIVCNLEKKVILKKCLLREIIGIHEENGISLYPFASWAYYPDLFNFWSQSPMDVVRENFQTRNIVINQAIDNNEAKNRPNRSYDPHIYKDRTKLKEYRDALIPVAKGTDPSKGIYIHPVNSIYDPKALNDMLREIAAQVTGVTPGGEGTEEGDQKVGIYYGNMQEVANRMSGFEDSYSNALNKMALLYLNGLKDHLDEEKAIKMIGEKGVEWEKLVKDDLGEFDIIVTGGLTEAQNDAIKAKAKADFIARHAASPVINPKAVVEMDALNAGFEPEEVKRLLEPNDASEEMTVRAAEDIQKLLLGEDFLPFRKADTAYMENILEFYEKTEMKPEQEKRFQGYIDAIQDIVIKNTVLKAQRALAQQGLLPTPNAPGMPPGEPGGPELQPQTKGATIDRASQITNNLKPNYATEPIG